MIENAPAEEEQEIPDACFQCNSPDYEPGYQVKLCKACRKRFSRYPLSRNIVLGAIGLAILFAFSVYKFREQFKAAITYEKGLDFADNREFISAQAAFYHILRLYPEHEKSKVHLLKAYFFNDNTEQTTALLAQLDAKPDYKINPGLEEEVESVREMWLKNKEQSEELGTAAMYFLDKRFTEADSLLKIIIHKNPTNWFASRLLSACLRQEKKYTEALSEINRTLSYNHQQSAALAEKAIVLLMLNKDKEALALAEQADKLEPLNSTNLFTLGVARYYNNDIAGAREALRKMDGLTTDSYHPADSLNRIITQHINLRTL